MSTSPNILLVILDSTRARNCSLYGYERETTPYLSEFAEEATIYNQARAPSIHSIASHVSIFTGCHVEEHQAIQHSAEINLEETIWKQLAEKQDYQTGLFTSNYIISSASNLGEAFETVYTPPVPVTSEQENKLFEDAYGPRDTDEHQSVSNHLYNSIKSKDPAKSTLNCVYDAFTKITSRYVDKQTNKTIPGYMITEEFIDWCTEITGRWAACINLMDTHSPFVPLAEFDNWDVPSKKINETDDYWKERQKRIPKYDGSIRQADDVIRNLIRDLEKTNELKDTLIVVTSDHGEGFGEHSEINSKVRMSAHKWGIHEVLTHVPLLVKYPGQTDSKQVSSAVSLTDFPRMVDRVLSNEEIANPFITDGPVLASTYRLLNEEADKVSFVEDTEPYLGPWRAVYENQSSAVRKYCSRQHDESATVDISDPQTQTVVSKTGGEIVDQHFSALELKNILIDGERKDLDKNLKSHLEDLGYIR